MTFQFTVQSFESDTDDCLGAHVIHDNPYGLDLIFVAQHCDGSWTCNLQSANGSSGWQSDAVDYADACRQADIAVKETGGIRIDEEGEA